MTKQFIAWGDASVHPLKAHLSEQLHPGPWTHGLFPIENGGELPALYSFYLDIEFQEPECDMRREARGVADPACTRQRIEGKYSMGKQTERAKMLAGELYRSADPDLLEDTKRAQRLVRQYNATTAEETEARMALLRRLCGSVGDGAVIRPPFACDYGYNIQLGRNAFINFNCVFLDCAPIEIGDNLQMGPAVQLYTAAHPLEAEVRRSGLEYARPIRIGHDVWIGGGAIILPGVTIGDGSVIGAGSVVTRDVPPGSVVVGNPARVIRVVRVDKDERA